MLEKLKHSIINLPGWHTDNKYVIIESDDWGSIRLSSKASYEHLKKLGYQLDCKHYNRFDALASEDDLTILFEVLSGVRDKNGNPAVITANTVMTNPDFEKIKETDFSEYHFELFTTTLQKYPKHKGAFKLWKEGMAAGTFRPQFHGREHLNIHRWMKALKAGHKDVHLAFGHQMFDLSTSYVIGETSFMDTLNLENIGEIEEQKIALKEGLKIFEEIFGYRSITFIAPCYIWSRKLNEILWQMGIKGFQGGWWQFEPIPGKEHKFKKLFHYTGQRNKLGQVYTVRNAFFEPSENPNFDWVSDVMKRAEMAFRWGKPLIISSHRVNYIGFIEPLNRDQNVRLLQKLLKSLLNRWPDIEFISSDKLTKLILKEA